MPRGGQGERTLGRIKGELLDVIEDWNKSDIIGGDIEFVDFNPVECSGVTETARRFEGRRI